MCVCAHACFVFGHRLTMYALYRVYVCGSRVQRQGMMVTKSEWQLCIALHESTLTDSQIASHFASRLLSWGHLKGSEPNQIRSRLQDSTDKFIFLKISISSISGLISRVAFIGNDCIPWNETALRKLSEATSLTRTWTFLSCELFQWWDDNVIKEGFVSCLVVHSVVTK